MGKRKLTLEQIKNIIEIESGSECKLLNTEYNGDKDLLKLECKCGNEFNTTYDRFRSKNQRQCKECSYKLKYSKSKYGNYTKENYIEIVKNRYLELNRSPRKDDFGSKYNLLSADVIIRNLNVETWNEVLQICNSGKTKERFYNTDIALNLLKTYIESLGYVPTRNELYSSKIQPSINWFCNKFGSYENTLKEIGLTRETTNENLIDLLKDFYVKNGKSPKKKDMCKFNGLPSAEVYFLRFNTSSWNEILKIANLELNHVNDYDLNYGLKRLKDLYNLLGKIPTREDFKLNKWLPSHTWYGRKFGNYENALKQIGIITYENKEEEAIKNLIELANKQKRVPNFEIYKKYNHSLGLKVDILGLLNMTYNEICSKYLPQYELNNVYQNPTKEELIENMFNLHNLLNRTPNVRDLKLEISKYPFSCYQRVFKDKNYIEIITEIGLEYNIESSIRKSDEKLLNDFKDLFYELKRIPYTRDIEKCNYSASATTYRKRFGTFENICTLLDIDYKQYYRKSGAGIVSFDKNGNICKSTPEKDISDFFIDNGIYFEKEISYDDLIKNDNTKRRFDFKIKYKDKWYYVEYFGMYNNKPRGHIDGKYLKKSKRKIKDLYKAGVINQCIFIFPKDIKYNKNESLQQKLESFLLSKYNIDVKENFNKCN